MKKLIFLVSFSLLIGNMYAADKANAKASSKQSSKIEEPIVAEQIVAGIANAAPAMMLSNEADSLTYAFGMYYGIGLSNELPQILGKEINTDLLIQAFENAVLNKPTLIDNRIVGMYIQQTMSKKQEQQAAESQQKNAEFQQKNADFLTENAKEKGVETLPSGLQYKVLTKGAGAKPIASDQVKVHYEGSLVDGTVFDSSVERGQPAVFGVTGVIQGWVEALQLMPVGSKWRLFIPYNLAYGERGSPPKIPPFATLIFDVQLLEIIK